MLIRSFIFPSLAALVLLSGGITGCSSLAIPSGFGFNSTWDSTELDRVGVQSGVFLNAPLKEQFTAAAKGVFA